MTRWSSAGATARGPGRSPLLARAWSAPRRSPPRPVAEPAKWNLWVILPDGSACSAVSSDGFTYTPGSPHSPPRPGAMRQPAHPVRSRLQQWQPSRVPVPPAQTASSRGRLRARVRPARHRVPAVIEPQRLPLSWFETNCQDWLEFKCAASGLTHGRTKPPRSIRSPTAKTKVRLTSTRPRTLSSTKRTPSGSGRSAIN